MRVQCSNNAGLIAGDAAGSGSSTNSSRSSTTSTTSVLAPTVTVRVSPNATCVGDENTADGGGPLDDTADVAVGLIRSLHRRILRAILDSAPPPEILCELGVTVVGIVVAADDVPTTPTTGAFGAFVQRTCRVLTHRVWCVDTF